MSSFLSVWWQVARGKTLMRALMNEALRGRAVVPGVVLDVGGGQNPSYRFYLKGWHDGVRNLDQQYGKGAAREIDFETDALPYEGEAVDQILFFNVLEHVYHHGHLASELARILKPGSQMLGFVPFLINYHPDPRDFFRYTEEALERIFRTAGFSSIKIHTIGRGPFAVVFNTLTTFMPRFLMAIVWPFCYVADQVVLALRPAFRTRYPLGYFFILTK